MPLDASIYGNLKLPQAMSLGDMVNLARGAQTYQQAQQINPLAVQQQQAQTQSAQQQAETGGIDLQIRQQQNQERLALQDYMSKPENWQTDGKIDMAKLNDAVLKIAPLTGSDVISKLAGISTAQTNAKDAERKFTKTTRENVASRLGILGRAGIQDPNAYINELNLAAQENPNDKDLLKYVQAQKDLISHVPKGANIANAAIIKSQQLLAPTEAQAAFTPTAGTADLGGAVYTTEAQPSVGGNKPSITLGGKLGNKTLAPQLAPTIEGGLAVVGGGGGSNVGGGGAGTTGAPSVGGNLQPQPGQTKESTQANINTAFNNYRDSLDQQNNPESKKGHIPSQLFNNQNIVKLLKDPEVDTSRIANYFSDPVKYKLLNSKEQDLAKFLEQRVQGLNPTSVMDLQSKHQAYGTTALKKDALMELIRNENGQLATKDLQARGRINAGKNPNNPDTNAINNFDNSFSVYAKDPLLMKYIGIVGEGKKAVLDKNDYDDISRLYARLPQKNGSVKEAANALELKRQALIKLVNGGQ